MKNKIYLRDELAAKFGIPRARFSELERLKLIRPAGMTEDQSPVYTEDAVEQIAHIQKLQELGYELEDITRIVRKVGLPKTDSDRTGQVKPDHYLTVGTLAEKAGLSPRTLKHWEEIGILTPEMRSEGGFRLYPEIYVYLCHLVKDLQLFGYTLEEIKGISDYFREFLEISEKPETASRRDVQARLELMLAEIDALFTKIELFKKGIERWEDLIKKKRKEIHQLKGKNAKTHESEERAKHA
jgi:MerR family transcriptional regulator, copper efflux regulator